MVKWLSVLCPWCNLALFKYNLDQTLVNSFESVHCPTCDIDIPAWAVKTAKEEEK